MWLRATLVSIVLLVSCYAFPYNIISTIRDVPNKLQQIPMFELHNIEVKNNYYLTQEQILEMANISDAGNVFAVDLNQVKRDIEHTGWVKSASVRRILPDRIEIDVSERIPRAVWWSGRKFYLVDIDGFTLKEVPEDELQAGYPLIAGDGANLEYKELLDLLVQKGLLERVKSIMYVGHHRWDLHMEDSIVVKMPALALSEAFDIVENVINERKDFAVIDLRLVPDKIYIKLKN